MGSLVYNRERFNQSVDFTGLSWRHPKEYSAWGVSDIDVRFELMRHKLYIEVEVKHESVDFNGKCKSQKRAMLNLHQVLENAGIKAPLCWATHKHPIGEEIVVADCIVQDYLEKGFWKHDGVRTVKKFMTSYIQPIINPIVVEPPHCEDCRFLEGCVSNEDADEDPEQACPLFERDLTKKWHGDAEELFGRMRDG